MSVRAHRRETGPRAEVFRFLVDTGSDCTTVPAAVARAYHIRFEDTQGKRGEIITQAGKLYGYWGEIEINLLEDWVRLPCFFVVGASAKDADDWLEKQAQPEEQQKVPPRLVLGRAGLISKYNIIIKGYELIIVKRIAPAQGAQ
jgi:hypothetical protein